ncbi:hypothetical protein BH11CYA1_BH11CYA1_12780 [soil metagenome]
MKLLSINFRAHKILALPLFAAIATGAIVSSCPEAKADPGFVSVPKKLQPATWHTSPWEIQIVDERMRVKNFVQPDAPVENAVIAIPPYANAIAGSSASVKMVGNRLPSAGFASQIPAGGFAPSRTLPQTKMGGITPVAAVRPIGLNQRGALPASGKSQTTTKAVSATPIAAEYAQTARPASNSFSFEQSVKADVRAKLRSTK